MPQGKRRNETREERNKRIAAAMERIFDKHDATFRALADDTNENGLDAGTPRPSLPQEVTEDE